MHIGRFSGVKKKCGDRITIGLLQSFARRSDFEELKDRFGTIIVDECHHIPAATFRKVISVFNPRYIYGLTATPERKHNDEKLIFFYTGDIIARLEKQDVFPLPQVEVFIKSTNLIVPFKFKTDLFQLLSKVICYDTTRNQLIVEDILTQKTIGRKVLVLSERKEHLEMLNLYIKGICETILITGDDSTAARKSKIRQIEGGNYEIILSTGQFFGEGMDVRGINCLILAFPFSFEGKLIQYIGRMRDVGDQRIIIDYRDINIPFLDRQFKKRKRFYKKTMTIPSTKELIQ
jgi:superfamily II DNA or RNA helicase